MLSTVEIIRRLGKKKNKERSIIPRAYDYNEKIEVFNNCRKLKESNISMRNDCLQVSLNSFRLLSAKTILQTVGRRWFMMSFSWTILSTRGTMELMAEP